MSFPTLARLFSTFKKGRSRGASGAGKIDAFSGDWVTAAASAGTAATPAGLDHSPGSAALVSSSASSPARRTAGQEGRIVNHSAGPNLAIAAVPSANQGVDAM